MEVVEMVVKVVDMEKIFSYLIILLFSSYYFSFFFLLPFPFFILERYFKFLEEFI